MNKKTLFIILLFFLLQNCGYTPIYKNIKNLDYNLNIVNISGNNDSEERLGGTISSSLYAMTQGIQMLRIHDANEVNQSIKVFKSLKFK